MLLVGEIPDHEEYKGPTEKKTMPYSGFEPETFGFQVSLPNKMYVLNGLLQSRSIALRQGYFQAKD
jgi:hypothetical protein